MAQYLIRKIETCPVCKGERWLLNLDWQEINHASVEWGDAHDATPDENIADWRRRIAEKWPHSKPPPESDECHECEGEGEIETLIPLRQAMRELAEQGTATDDVPPGQKENPCT